MKFLWPLRNLLSGACRHPVRWVCQTWLAASLRFTLILSGVALMLGFWLATADGTQSVQAASIQPSPDRPAPPDHWVEMSMAAPTGSGSTLPARRRNGASSLTKSVPVAKTVTTAEAVHHLELTTTVMLGHHLTDSRLFFAPSLPEHTAKTARSAV